MDEPPQAFESEPEFVPPRERGRRAFWGAQPRTRPDPGSPTLGRLGLLLVVVLIGLVAVFQQMATSSAAKAAGQPPLAPGVVPPPSVQIELVAKTGVKFYHVSSGGSPAAAAQRADLARQIVDSLRPDPGQPFDVLRVAIVKGELQGADAALADLEKLDRFVEGPEALADEQTREFLRQDLQTLRTIYADQSPPPDAVQALELRHKWFGELAASYGLNDTHPDRQKVIGGGVPLVLLLVALMLAALVLFITGLTLFIVAIVKASTGSLPSRFVPPLPGGSIAVETVVIFVGGFIALKFVTAAVAAAVGEARAMWFALTAQWLLMLLILWPVVRGVPLRGENGWLQMAGLHRGRGVWREMGAGIVGYVACLPILAAGMLVTLVLVMVQAAMQQAAGKQPAPPENPIIELAGGGKGPAAIVLLFLLASIWAPLVEEAVFRGALYRHLRAWWHWLPAGLVTALGFGLMHGYPLILLGPVISLGFGFALIREWRGSLIGCMTAHALHNATMLVVLLVVFRVVGL